MSVSAAHHNLPLDALGQLSKGARSIASIIRRECPAVMGIVALATCNRFEIYLDTDSPDATDQHGHPPTAHATHQIAQLIALNSGIPVEMAFAALRVRHGAEVALHLFRVAAGLDSMVIGEREISGQVKRAIEVARAAGTTSKTLELLFQTASRSSKRVAHTTGISAVGRSLVSIGVELAATRLPKWPKVRALLIGTGSYAGAAYHALRSAGCSAIAVYSPSGRASHFTAHHPAVPVTDIREALRHVDIVVACSGATSDYVVDAATVRAVRHTASDSTPPLVALDLALRHDIDPRVTELGVARFDLNDLGDRIPRADVRAVATAERLVSQAAQGFEHTKLIRSADDAVVALVHVAEQQIASEVAELIAIQPASGTELELVTAGVRRRVYAALHPRILQIRANAVNAPHPKMRVLVSSP